MLLTAHGVLKLTDFGVAKILADIERCQSTSGTHGYMVSNKQQRINQIINHGMLRAHWYT
jgi:serine/threonine protein kinase